MSNNFVSPYPVDVLGDVLGGPKPTQDMEVRRELAWDYQQLGDDAFTAIEHTVAIKKSERRASEAIIEAGQHLIAMKDMLNHGQWGDWLTTEFQMTDRTAQRMMQVAEKFNGKNDKLSDLKPSVLYMLAADNVPEAAREQVITEAQQTRPTIRRVRQVIEEHSPRPVAPAKTVYTPVTITGNSEPTPGTPIPPPAPVLNTPAPAEPLTLDDLEVIDSVTFPWAAPVPAHEVSPLPIPNDEEITHPLDCYEDIDMAAVVAEDLATLERMKWPLKLQKLYGLKEWFTATRSDKLHEYTKLTGREIPGMLTGALNHMIAVLEEAMDAVEVEAANANQ